MVRRSLLVYDLLRTEQPSDGFSQKEIVTHISGKYDMVAGKTLHKDVAAALRRGLDFGILARNGNKFRFDPNFHEIANLKRNITKRQGGKETKRKKRTNKKKPTGKSTAAKGRRQQQRRKYKSRDKDRKQSQSAASVPRPKLPRPPSWSPKRRHLAEEPIPKVRHA